MIRFRAALIAALLAAGVPALAHAATATTPPARTLAHAQAKRYAKSALQHRFGRDWVQRDPSATYFKCRRKATLKFACRVVWLRHVRVYDGRVGVSLRPDPADDGWYYDLKIKRTNYSCSDLCPKTFDLPWSRGGSR